MPPRVTYWTGTWDPRQEAISKEIATLRGALGARAPVVAFSPGHGTSCRPASRVLTVAGDHWPVLRVVGPIIERLGDVTHVFGPLDAWHLLRAVGRRPTLMTVVISSAGSPAAPLDRVRVFVAESEPLADEIRKTSVPPESVRVVYPGIDLDEFRPATPPAGPFRLLFASSPADPREFDDRGLPLLVEIARACPDVEVVLLWRDWGNQDAARQALARLSPPENLALEHRQGRTMAEVYRGAHAIACLYADGFGKSCPNSVVEALASGLPALVSRGCGIASLVESHGAGLAVSREVPAAIAAVRALQANRTHGALAARRLATRLFDVRHFVSSYASLYDELAQAVPAARDVVGHRPPPMARSVGS